MRHYKSIYAIVMTSAFAASGLANAQASQEFKVTLAINESGDQCLWGGGTEGNGERPKPTPVIVRARRSYSTPAELEQLITQLQQALASGQPVTAQPLPAK